VVLKNQIRPFVTAARPVVRQLQPAAVNLAKATPNLSSSFSVVNHFLNLVGFNPTPSGQHGYLWWAAWLGHIGRTVFAVQDGNGDFRQAFLQVSCATITQILNGINPALLQVYNLLPILSDINLCPPQALALKAQYRSYLAGQKGGLSSHASGLAGRSRGSSLGNLFLPSLPNH
jgi:hypothetical protein